MELSILSPATGAAMVVAGLLSVVLFPLGALTILRAGEKPASAGEPANDLEEAYHEQGRA
jgi:hypothetical protein